MNRKENTKRRNMQSVMVIALLLAVLSLCSGCRINLRSRYKNANKYKAGDFEYNASEVSKAEINWINGSIEIRQTGGKVLSVREEGGKLSKAKKLHWYLDGDTLRIQYCKSGYNGHISSKAKNLIVEVPEGIDLAINTVSSDLTMDKDQKYGSLKINTVSGEADLYIDECRKISVDTVSGDIDLNMKECQEADIDTVSANVTFRTLPEDGAVIRFDSVSGSLDAGRTYEKKDKNYVFGEGSCKIGIDTVSGDVNIQ